ncbi:hypothetical protein DSECCO2_626000 [anaerobic digester metagenome]
MGIFIAYTGNKGLPDEMLHALLRIPGIRSIHKRGGAVRHAPDDKLGLILDDTPVPGLTHPEPLLRGNLIGDILNDQRDTPGSILKYRRHPFHAEMTLCFLQNAAHLNDPVWCVA